MIRPKEPSLQEKTDDERTGNRSEERQKKKEKTPSHARTTDLTDQQIDRQPIDRLPSICRRT